MLPFICIHFETSKIDFHLVYVGFIWSLTTFLAGDLFWQQYHLDKEVKQDTSAKPVEVKEVVPEVTTQAEEVTKDQTKEESPVEEAVSAVEEKSESAPESTEVTSEAPAAAAEDNAEETPPAVEENNDENTSEEVAEETPDEIKVYCSSQKTYFDTLTLILLIY